MIVIIEETLKGCRVISGFQGIDKLLTRPVTKLMTEKLLFPDFNLADVDWDIHLHYSDSPFCKKKKNINY